MGEKRVLFRIAAVFFGVLVAFCLCGGLELFFRLNKKKSWIKHLERPVYSAAASYDITALHLDYLNGLKPYEGKSDFDEPSDYGTLEVFPNCAATREKRTPFWLGIPNCGVKVTLRKMFSRRVVYSTSYSFDKFGRRIVPDADAAADKFLLFLGCSRTLGEGVDDHATFPNLIAQKLKRNAYNLGMAAYGPNEILELLQQGKSDLRLEVINVNS
jgi:hypothetical protein